MKERKVYTISVLFGTGKEWRFRDWGYYFDEVHAREVIEENQTDISELGYYQYGILSAKGEGPLAIDEPIQWYEFIWNEQQEFVRANKIDIPPQYEQQFLPVSSKAAEAPGGQRAEGCSCGSHDLAELYHHPKCALAPAALSERAGKLDIYCPKCKYLFHGFEVTAPRVCPNDGTTLQPCVREPSLSEERERFERWARNESKLNLAKNGDRYRASSTRIAWMTWCGRAGLSSQEGK